MDGDSLGNLTEDEAQATLERLKSQTSQGEQNSEPLEKESEPIEKESEPIEKESEPIEKESEPIEKETEPLEKETEPLVKETEPLEKETEPIEKESEPIEKDPVQTEKNDSVIPAVLEGYYDVSYENNSGEHKKEKIYVWQDRDTGDFKCSGDDYTINISQKIMFDNDSLTPPTAEEVQQYIQDYYHGNYIGIDI